MTAAHLTQDRQDDGGNKKKTRTILSRTNNENQQTKYTNADTTKGESKCFMRRGRRQGVGSSSYVRLSEPRPSIHPSIHPGRVSTFKSRKKTTLNETTWANRQMPLSLSFLLAPPVFRIFSLPFHFLAVLSLRAIEIITDDIPMSFPCIPHYPFV